MGAFVYEAIIPAAGTSARFGTDKMLARVGTGAVIEGAVRPFLEDPRCTRVLLMAGADSVSLAKLFAAHAKAAVLPGGSTRHATVRKGLAEVGAAHVLVHDGARPFLTKELLARVVDGLSSAEAVVPVVAAVDSVLQTAPPLRYIERAHLRLVQTPQGFVTDRLKEAFARAEAEQPHGDEGSLYLAHFGPKGLRLVEGDPKNAKITYAHDAGPPL